MRTLPFVTLNGTSRDSLVEQNHDAAIAINKAIAVVRDAAPHGRDYIGHPEEFRAAQQLFVSMVAALNRVEQHFTSRAEILVFNQENEG